MKRITGLFLRLMKPLMNQRGEVGSGAAPDPITVQLDENGFIPGTTFKSVDDLVNGFKTTKADHSRISAEHSTLKSQAEVLAQAVKEGMGKGKEAAPPEAKGIDYDSEITQAHKDLATLKYDDAKYEEKQADLVKKIADLTAAKASERVIDLAGKQFMSELSKRDQEAASRTFKKNNPTFDTPEMKARIADFLRQDETGMHDDWSAFFAIQADDNAAVANQTRAENEGMKKILELQNGKDKTGKVIQKSQPAGLRTGKTIVTGKDLDNGMAEALRKVNGG
jgi:hypothetical protein